MKLPYSIREQDPLKQGLKLFCGLQDLGDMQIREQDPLKQGLKQTKNIEVYNNVFNS